MTTTTSATSPTQALADSGVSIWLDDLSRARVSSGELQHLIADRNVVGITTNPTIFATALRKGDAYKRELRRLAREHVSPADAVVEVTTADVRAACDVLRPVYDRTAHLDGWVSIEVSPASAHDVSATVAEARRLRAKVDRDNVFVKVPATLPGLEAVTELIAEGVSVNVTLIFGLERYRAVLDAYLSGLERAHRAGIPLAGIHSVASVFVSRVDAEVDRRLDAIGTPAAGAVRGRTGIATARLAYQAFEDAFLSARGRHLLRLGATLQRPLWASTGVKDPALPDTTYVVELVAPNVVNTMPLTTLEATFDHADVRGDTIHDSYSVSSAVLEAVTLLGVPLPEVMQQLEDDGVRKFDASWDELRSSVAEALRAFAPVAAGERVAGHART
jgi:transaldolase